MTTPHAPNCTDPDDHHRGVCRTEGKLAGSTSTPGTPDLVSLIAWHVQAAKAGAR